MRRVFGILMAVGLAMPVANGQVTLDIVRKTGDTAPGTTGTFESFGVPFINDSGQIVFYASTDMVGSGQFGIWRWSPSGPSTAAVAIAGQSSGIGSATFADVSRNPSINNNGQVAFRAGLSDGSAVLRWAPSTYTVVAQSSQAAPGASGSSLGVNFGPLEDGTYPGEFRRVLLADSGDVAFEHVNFSNDLGGWWIGDGSSLNGLAYRGSGSWAQYPGWSTTMSGVTGADINASGTAALTITYGVGSQDTSWTLWRGVPNSLTLIAQNGDAAPLAPGGTSSPHASTTQAPFLPTLALVASRQTCAPLRCTQGRLQWRTIPLQVQRGTFLSRATQGQLDWQA